MNTKSCLTVAGALLAATALALSGCASGGSDPSHASSSSTTAFPAVTKVADLVPAAIKKSGTLVIGTNAPYPPLEYYASNDKTLTGFDIDLGTAVAQTMGLRADWKNVSFDNIIPGMEGGRYDMGMAGFGIEPERLGAVDFVSYYLNGGGFFVLAKSKVRPTGFNTSLCGLRIAVQSGTSQVQRLDVAEQACKAAGRASLKVLQIPSQTQVALTLSSGRADAVVADLAAAEYTVKQSEGAFCISGLYKTPQSLAGIAVPKSGETAGLTGAVKAALDALRASGGYEKIVKKWGLVEGAVSSFTVYTKPSQVSDSNQITSFAPKAGCRS